MSDRSPIYLPGEVVHAILVRVKDRDAEDALLKHGLTSCSLICRHWAKVIRPILFFELNLKSADDISQLIEFLSQPDFLGHSLQNCIHILNIVGDRTPQSIPWVHQMLRLKGRFAFINITLVMEGIPEADLPQPEAKHISLLPFSWLPKTLPMSFGFLNALTLSGMRVPSIRALVDCVAHLRVGELTLENITFSKQEVEVFRFRRPRHFSPEFYLSISHCFQDTDDLTRWFRISNFLFARQGYMMLNDVAWALVDKHIPLLLSLTRHQDQIKHMSVRSRGYSGDVEEGYEYSLHNQTEVVAELTVYTHRHRPAHPDIRYLRLTCPAISTADMPSCFDDFETALLDLNGTNVPLLTIICLDMDLVRDVIELLRMGSIFPHLFGRLRKVHIMARGRTRSVRRELTAAGIHSSFAPFTLDGERITLDKAQRVQWLLRKQSDGGKKAYLRELLQAHAVRARSGTNLELESGGKAVKSSES
ncbi:uncharacterized protein PHACADRAFT_149780 [Phanerochaete carnosa HHB-10118-sp]|uniref:F-box domain-containing protein n=1 Tax=Phanerochaete carnosa (strain HHB-10118-sp) TaxID=650164 RepID=K5VN46_PHACS|nr:uncharacterized protein PHACADRAFT_149780 [Phanerochaete carnosa HHB-10118-sp]EKM52853.1 hypothetical protein PHACADRAFT_149780 [Phanerochaete carnosa HHB-10118-sp]